MYGPIPDERKDDFIIEATIAKLPDITTDAERMLGARLLNEDLHTGLHVTFNEHTLYNGHKLQAAFIPLAAMKAFASVSGLYPAIGQTVSATIRPATDKGNIVLWLRPTIGGTQSAAA